MFVGSVGGSGSVEALASGHVFGSNIVASLVAELNQQSYRVVAGLVAVLLQVW